MNLLKDSEMVPLIEWENWMELLMDCLTVSLIESEELINFLMDSLMVSLMDLMMEPQLVSEIALLMDLKMGY